MPILDTCDVIAFVGTSNAAHAKAFYGDKLGLALVSEDMFALVYDANGTMLRVTPVGKVTPLPYTLLGWAVTDIEGAALALQQAGVVFEHFPGLEQTDLGIWTAPGGSAKVAWFKDPDGNVLSISQH